jgi:hypothetical protein
VVLECLEVTEAWKTLGFKTAPTGYNGAQFDHMLEASHKWAAQKEGNTFCTSSVNSPMMIIL